MSLAAGTKLGRYEIRSKIGEGGMGEVYLAHDSKLDRKVALKILPPEVAAHPDRMKRFVQEAKAASALNHPNIITIYEIDDTDSGHFIATEFIDGETLRQHLRKAPVKLGDVLDIAGQIASALSAAHSAGIVHRDIKPENIMLRRDGIVKVLDFGLAKLTQAGAPAIDTQAATRPLVQTEPGRVMGTVAYMSPEQVRGLELDARTDIWSFGVVLYEMIAGRAPFGGETSSHISVSILEREPTPVGQCAPNVPAELQRIVRKALAKDREDRYQTARDVLIDLKNLRRDLDLQSELERSSVPPFQTSTSSSPDAGMDQAIDAGKTQSQQIQISTVWAASFSAMRKRALTIGLAVLLLAGLAVGYWFFVRGRDAATQIESIAVLPLVNASGNSDLEYLSDGISESLITRLSQIPKLAVKARSSVFRYRGQDISARQVGKELNVQAIVSGRVLQHGNDLTLHLELVDANSETALWSEDYKGSMTNLISLQNEIVQDVSSRLKPTLSGPEKEKLSKNYPSDTEAYRLYLKGRFYWNRRTAQNLRKAIEEFQQAVDRDPNYALAWVGLADCYQLLEEYAGAPSTETTLKAQSYAQRALQIDDSLAEAHVSMGGIKYKLRQFEESEREIRRGIQLNSNYPTAHHWYSVLLRIERRFDESLAEIKRAQELDPLSPIVNDNVGQVYLVMGATNAAVEQYKKLIDLDPNFASGRRWYGKTMLVQHRYDEAIRELETAVRLSERSNGELAALGYGYGIADRRDDAVKIRKELEEKYKHAEARALDVAVVSLGLGETDEAFVWLEKAYQDNSGTLGYLNWDIYFDSLRSDARFVELIRRLGLQL